jgi:hypothetical protein
MNSHELLIDELSDFHGAAKPQMNGTRILRIERICADFFLVKIKPFMSHPVHTHSLKQI